MTLNLNGKFPQKRRAEITHEPESHLNSKFYPERTPHSITVSPKPDTSASHHSTIIHKTAALLCG
jgi:hypothetical protein